MAKEDARFQKLEQLHERRKQVVRSHLRGIRVMAGSQVDCKCMSIRSMSPAGRYKPSTFQPSSAHPSGMPQ